MAINRREFIEGAGLVAGGVAVIGALEPVPADSAEQPATRVPVTAIVNGQPRTIAVEPRTTLLDALREQLRLTGTKKGCDRGECGACTVLVDARRVLSCMSLALMQRVNGSRRSRGSSARASYIPCRRLSWNMTDFSRYSRSRTPRATRYPRLHCRLTVRWSSVFTAACGAHIVGVHHRIRVRVRLEPALKRRARNGTEVL